MCNVRDTDCPCISYMYFSRSAIFVLLSHLSFVVLQNWMRAEGGRVRLRTIKVIV